MTNIRCTLLGTANAMPTKARNHSAIVLEYENEHILIDCGEGTQRQFRRAEINPCKLTRILITHLHGDHTLGLPGLLETLTMSTYAKTLKIYGPRGLKNHFALLEHLYGKFKLKFEVHEIADTHIDERDIQIETRAMYHGIATNAYSFIVKERRRIDKRKLVRLKLPNSPLLKDLQQGRDIMYNKKKIKAKDITYIQPGKKITVILDTGMNQNAIELAKKADLLVCEATYAAAEESVAQEYKHLTTTQAATIAKKAGVKKLILTHLSQRYEHTLPKLEKEARKIFKNAALAQDLQTFVV